MCIIRLLPTNTSIPLRKKCLQKKLFLADDEDDPTLKKMEDATRTNQEIEKNLFFF